MAPSVSAVSLGDEVHDVLISYSHDDATHKQRVLGLATALREDGVDAWLDRFTTEPPEGWPKCERSAEA